LGTGVEIQGTITRGLSADNTFEVNGQTVRLTPAIVFVGGTAADIAVGMHVEVEGTFAADGVLDTAVVDFTVDIEGSITRDLSADDTFEVDGQVVQLTPATVFEGGTAADIAVDVRVEVAGRFDAENRFVAAEIEFLP
jgi:Domain of unknown function (DUF5666)